MNKITQQELKRLLTNKLAQDLNKSNANEIKTLQENGLKAVAVSVGTYGVNGALLQDNNDIYVVIGRTSALFQVL